MPCVEKYMRDDLSIIEPLTAQGIQRSTRSGANSRERAVLSEGLGNFDDSIHIPFTIR